MLCFFLFEHFPVLCIVVIKVCCIVDFLINWFLGILVVRLATRYLDAEIDGSILSYVIMLCPQAGYFVCIGSVD